MLFCLVEKIKGFWEFPNLNILRHNSTERALKIENEIIFVSRSRWLADIQLNAILKGHIASSGFSLRLKNVARVHFSLPIETLTYMVQLIKNCLWNKALNGLISNRETTDNREE